MQKQPSTWQTIALSLHFLMVAAVLLHVCSGFINNIAVQLNRQKQQMLLSNMPRHASNLITWRMSAGDFKNIQLIDSKECLVADQYFDIVSIERVSGNVILTLITDHQETKLRNNLRQEIAGRRPVRRLEKMPVAGFLFFEEMEKYALPFYPLDNRHSITYSRCSLDGLLAVDPPPPKRRV